MKKQKPSLEKNVVSVIMSEYGRRGKGAAKRRGDSAYYRSIRAKRKAA